MHGNIKDWFKNDYWSHEEAACLMCGVNPRANPGTSLLVKGAHTVGNIVVLAGQCHRQCKTDPLTTK